MMNFVISSLLIQQFKVLVHQHIIGFLLTVITLIQPYVIMT